MIDGTLPCAVTITASHHAMNLAGYNGPQGFCFSSPIALLKGSDAGGMGKRSLPVYLHSTGKSRRAGIHDPSQVSGNRFSTEQSPIFILKLSDFVVRLCTHRCSPVLFDL